MKIEKQTVTQYVYVSSDGTKQLVADMPNPYLLNALLKAERENEKGLHATNPLDEVIEVLKSEVLSRMIGAGEI